MTDKIRVYEIRDGTRVLGEFTQRKKASDAMWEWKLKGRPVKMVTTFKDRMEGEKPRQKIKPVADPPLPVPTNDTNGMRVQIISAFGDALVCPVESPESRLRIRLKPISGGFKYSIQSERSSDPFAVVGECFDDEISYDGTNLTIYEYGRIAGVYRRLNDVSVPIWKEDSKFSKAYKDVYGESCDINASLDFHDVMQRINEGRPVSQVFQIDHIFRERVYDLLGHVFNKKTSQIRKEYEQIAWGTARKVYVAFFRTKGKVTSELFAADSKAIANRQAKVHAQSIGADLLLVHNVTKEFNSGAIESKFYKWSDYMGLVE